MIDIYLCDDEKVQLQYFEKILKEYIEIKQIDAQIVSTRTDPEEILSDIENQKLHPSLFFIDIQLDGYDIDGFELAKMLKERVPDCFLVFLTSQEGLAYRAFEYELGISEYIVKRPGDFLADGMSASVEGRINNIFAKIAEKSPEEKRKTIKLECGSRLVEIDKKEIFYIQATKEDHLVEICAKRQLLKVRRPLKEIYEMLDEEFLYVSKSCIVRRDKIREIDRKERYLFLENGCRVEVSFRKMKEVLDAYYR